MIKPLHEYQFFRSVGRRRFVYFVVSLLVVVLGVALDERPAHHFDTAYESCWTAEVNSVITGTSPHMTGICANDRGRLPGVGRLAATEPFSTSKRRDYIVFATGLGTHYAGLAYVVNATPPPDTCVTPLGGPWWQFRQGTSVGDCPRGYTFQPAP